MLWHQNLSTYNLFGCGYWSSIQETPNQNTIYSIQWYYILFLIELFCSTRKVCLQSVSHSYIMCTERVVYNIVTNTIFTWWIQQCNGCQGLLVFIITFSNISAISWLLGLLGEETPSTNKPEKRPTFGRC